MAIPLSDYYTRIDAMIQEALPDYRSGADRTALNAGSKTYGIRLVSMSPIDNRKITHVTYRFTWEILLAHGARDLGNKGIARGIIYSDIAAMQDYFDNHHNFILDTQTDDDMIAGFRTGSLSMSFVDEGDIGETRATRYSISFDHDVFYNARQV